MKFEDYKYQWGTGTLVKYGKITAQEKDQFLIEDVFKEAVIMMWGPKEGKSLWMAHIDGKPSIQTSIVQQIEMLGLDHIIVHTMNSRYFLERLSNDQ